MRKSFLLYHVLKTVITMSIAVLVLSFIVSRFSIQSVLAEGVDATILLNQAVVPGNLLFLPENKIREELKNDYPQFSDIRLERRWPNTLVVHFMPRIPIAIVRTDNRRVALDAFGYVLGDSSDTLLPPIISPYFELHTGKVIDNPAVTLSLAFLSEMGQDDGISEIRIGVDRTITVRMQSMTIHLSDDVDGKSQAWTLQRLLAGLRIKGSLPKSIDLRFAKPVIQL